MLASQGSRIRVVRSGEPNGGGATALAAARQNSSSLAVGRVQGDLVSASRSTLASLARRAGFHEANMTGHEPIGDCGFSVLGSA